MGLFCKIGNQSSIGLKTVNHFASSKKVATFAMSKDKNNIIKQFKTLWCRGQLLIRDMKIENLVNARGNKVANQFKVTTKDKIYFQSYQSIVVSVNRRTGKVQLYKDWNYSNTTRKHLYNFLWEYGFRNLHGKKAIEAAIKKGEVSYIDYSPSI